ncbi:Myomesin-1 190 kDa connectin-associated protein 190 kDa titin-associated protein [Takifugu flavidus]|uniref:Myomesin-1 190 kDa connectin-associated protein 190 kDa titin-associated protein n=1 Tax=Takifugu flavidus TaxID=433684 RepID=A0A5C6P2R3_9TELE|nr:Myomesin-1 190 kDa connectin-associated protein 190 kDa titin-associated protein [Takifugu flavidus]
MSGSIQVTQKRQHLQHQQQHQQQHHYESRQYLSSKSTVSKQSISTVKTTSHSQKTSVKTEKGQEVIKLSPLPKRAKRTYLAMDKDKEVLGYVIPVFRASHGVVRGLMEAQEEEVSEEGIQYVAMRNLFVREAREALDVKVEKKSRMIRMRESAERVELSKTVEEWVEFRRKMNPDSLTHPPEFIIKPRGQTVWEGQTLTLHCTVAGWPKPKIAWYKNNVLIDARAHPEKYTAESTYNMHSLEIKNCNFTDTAQYSISALNVKGEASYVATVVVKRFQEGEEVGPLVSRPHAFCSEYGVTFLTTITDKFEVAFGAEGETMSLGCTVIVYPTVKNYQPEVVWYRDSVPLKPSKWVQTHWSGERAILTLVHLNKEDEGMYTLRVNTKSGFDTYSAYVFVRDADVEVEGVPVAPLDVCCHDANKDYVVVTWKQPAVEGSSSILGYYIDRREVGTQHWAQCNDVPVKYARFPVTGLVEGRSYIFRVRALNKAGVSRPSRVSEAVVAMDPSDRARLRAGPSAPWTGIIKFTEEDPTVGIIPGEPTDVVVTEATKSYVVLAWKPPVQRGHEGVMYYIEKCISGTDSWQRVNTGMPVKSPRFAMFDLAEGKSYSFRVRCCNSAGVGEASVATGDITVGDILDLPCAPGNPVAIRNTSTSVVVSWGASKDVKRLVGYYIECSQVGTDIWMPCNNKPVKQTRFVCHGLTTGANYVFRVKAVNAAGYSLSSSDSEAVVVKAAIAVPGRPTGVTLLEAVKDYMVLGWTPPANDGGADVRGYFVDYRTVKGDVVGKWHEMNHQALTTTTYRAENLKENVFYEFQVRAMNMAGLSKASVPSAVLECKEWTITLPGAPVGLHVLEVRDTSVVLLWEPPAFSGRTPVNGYYVDVKEASAGEEGWKAIHEKANRVKYLKVKGLKPDTSYAFRVRAQNLTGVGKPSAALGPVLAQTHPGTKEIYVDVDDDGVISMVFECSAMTEGSEFIWSKNYQAITDSSRVTIVNEHGKSRAIFNDPSLEDLGTFSCVVTNTDGMSSSYTLTEEGLNRLLDISHDKKFPGQYPTALLLTLFIPFKHEMGIELLEKGRVRLWTQVEKSTSACQVDYVFNNTILTQGKKYSMNFDQSTGIIEMFMDSLEITDEGTFTFNLVDGKATGTTSLVLIGDEFRELQKKSEFERAEWIRKQGPHFVEYLGFAVTAECDVLLKCKIGNVRPETEIIWSKDNIEIAGDDEDAQKIGREDGELTFNIGKISKKDAGIYDVFLKDERGKDKSTFNLTDEGYQAVLNELFRVIANSSSEIQVLSTEHGIILYSTVTYYHEDQRIGWLHKDAKIAASERVKSGVTDERLWLQINEPTEKDKGKYTIDLFDGKDGIRRVFDLSGQAWEDAFEEFQRLKAAAIAERNRARVIGGLPDVVAIQEGKSLNLTGNVWGDPVPEVSWTKNDKELVSDDHYKLTYEHGKFASITIATVTEADSGKYALLVKNKYGTEAGAFTVSVYNPEEQESKEEKKGQ